MRMYKTVKTENCCCCWCGEEPEWEVVEEIEGVETVEETEAGEQE